MREAPAPESPAVGRSGRPQVVSPPRKARRRAVPSDSAHVSRPRAPSAREPTKRGPSPPTSRRVAEGHRLGGEVLLGDEDDRAATRQEREEARGDRRPVPAGDLDRLDGPGREEQVRRHDRAAVPHHEARHPERHAPPAEDLARGVGVDGRGPIGLGGQVALELERDLHGVALDPVEHGGERRGLVGGARRAGRRREREQEGRGGPGGGRPHVSGLPAGRVRGRAPGTVRRPSRRISSRATFLGRPSSIERW